MTENPDAADKPREDQRPAGMPHMHAPGRK